MFQTKFVGKIKTRILSSTTFFRKSRRLSENVDKFDRARQAIDDNAIRRMHVACWMNKGERTPRELETATLLQLPRISARPS
jgi:hypothetical protein